ncbi:MAG: 2-hydroxyacid dehydrogenase [Cyclobacteriaceae bacterium]
MSLVIICPERDPAVWAQELQKLDPSLEIEIYPNEKDLASISYALAWRHPYGVFGRYPNLRCISSMGAGVDHLLGDPDLPGEVPVVRLVDEKLASDMFEYILAVILAELRNLKSHFQNQTDQTWDVLPYKRMEDVRVGIMGMGRMGSQVSTRLATLGFQVSGWSRTGISDVGHRTYSGDKELTEFLSQTDMLVCLLPLTESTHGILNSKLFGALPRGAYVINAGRGEHLVEADLLEALNRRQLSGATLDVFIEEPLPPGHPFWNHPRITISPHLASVTDPVSCAPQVLENYKRMETNSALLNLVSKEKGY